jgi:voltage-gated potassium channel
MPLADEPSTRSALGHVIRGVTLLAIIVSLSIAGYVAAGWSLLDAAYMVVITIFGVGYGEVRTLNHPGLKLFTMVVVIAGCSAGLWVIGSLVDFMADGKIREALGKRRMNQQIDELKGHAIVCGFGRVGQILCRDLAKAGMPLVVIDTDPQRLAMAESLGYPMIAGDAAEDRTLIAAHIDTARVVAVVLPDDAANVFVTLSARELNGSVEIIARGERPDTEPKLLRSGANRVVLPAAAGASRIARMIVAPSAESLLADAASLHAMNQQLHEIGMEIGEIAVPSDGELVGARLADLDMRGTLAVIVAIRRPDGEIRRTPHASTVLEPGDTLIVAGRYEDLPRTLKRVAAAPAVSWRGASKA